MYKLVRSGSQGTYLSLDEVKTYLKVDNSADDTLITNLIAQVISHMEGYSWRSLVPSTYIVYTNEFGDYIPLRRGPVSGITLIQYYDTSNAIQTLDSGSYFLAIGQPDRVCLEYGYTWPTLFDRSDAIIVTYTTNPSIEESVKEDTLKAIGYLYQHRDSIEVSLNQLFKSVTMGHRSKYI